MKPEPDTRNTLPDPPSLWRATAPDLPETPVLDGQQDTRIAVIGAGFTGCSAALHLAEQGVPVTVLDAGQPGIGASGRNGGQVNPGIKLTVEQVQRIWGDELGRELYRTIGDAPDLVFDLIKRHGIRCHPVRTGIIQPAYSRKSLDYLKRYGDYQAGTGAPVRILDRQRTGELIGSTFYCGGFLDERAGSVQPLAYCRGLAEAAIRNKAVFFGNSPVTRIESSGDRKILHTPTGRVAAEQILVCTNGYTDLVARDPLIRKLSRTVIPFYSYQVATAPLPDEIQETVIPQLQVVADTRRLLTYFRKDPQGRLVMGSAGGPYNARGAGSYQPVVDRIREIYPRIGTPRIEFRWSGRVCITADGVPHVHALSPGIYTGLGYNGRGVAMATLMGKWLAALVTGVRPDTPTIPVTTARALPFHALHNPVIRAMLTVNDLQDRMEGRQAAIP